MAGIGLMYMNPEVSRHLFNTSKPVPRGEGSGVPPKRGGVDDPCCLLGMIDALGQAVTGLESKAPDQALRIELTLRNEATGFSATYKVSDAKELRAVFRIFCKAQAPD
ncbi:hypothetical protein FOZ60_001648, partial [Perkinsus olseni]